MGRAPCCDKANVKKGPWSPEEDAMLKQFIEVNGTMGNWITLPSKAGLKRCGKSCRLRWINYLRPDIKHGSFTEEEEKIIYYFHEKLGSRWSLIAGKLKGRTDNDIKNYWNTRLKKKLAEKGMKQQLQRSYHEMRCSTGAVPPMRGGGSTSGPLECGYRQMRMTSDQLAHHQMVHYYQQQQHQQCNNAMPQVSQQQIALSSYPAQQQQQQMLPVKNEIGKEQTLEDPAVRLLAIENLLRSCIVEPQSDGSDVNSTTSTGQIHQSAGLGPISPVAAVETLHRQSPTSSCSGGSDSRSYGGGQLADSSVFRDNCSLSSSIENSASCLSDRQSRCIPQVSWLLPRRTSKQVQQMQMALMNATPSTTLMDHSAAAAAATAITNAGFGLGEELLDPYGYQASILPDILMEGPAVKEELSADCWTSVNKPMSVVSKNLHSRSPQCLVGKFTPQERSLKEILADSPCFRS